LVTSAAVFSLPLLGSVPFNNFSSPARWAVDSRAAIFEWVVFNFYWACSNCFLFYSISDLASSFTYFSSASSCFSISAISFIISSYFYFSSLCEAFITDSGVLFVETTVKLPVPPFAPVRPGSTLMVNFFGILSCLDSANAIGGVVDVVFCEAY
jgi:hypothetical protein